MFGFGKRKAQKEAEKAYSLECAKIELETAKGLMETAVFDLDCQGVDTDNLLGAVFRVASLMKQSKAKTLELNNGKVLTLEDNFLKITTH
jgi:hypothetical protein